MSKYLNLFKTSDEYDMKRDSLPTPNANKVEDNGGDVVSAYQETQEEEPSLFTNAVPTELVEATKFLTLHCNGSQTIALKNSDNSTSFPYVQYSFDKSNWNRLLGSPIAFNGDIYLRGTNEDGFSTSRRHTSFVFGNSTDVSVSGDIMYLISVAEDLIDIPNEHCFAELFKNCPITSAPSLPATNVKDSCYYYMFSGTKITSVPTLPSMYMDNSCYEGMFAYCTAIVNVPTTLPAIALDDYCYKDMFKGCTSITETPALPSTILSDGCYDGMFSGCTSLANAPLLPATTLKRECYQGMFNGCTALEVAPYLPATALRTDCYKEMFKDCANLNYISADFLNEPSDQYTQDWVKGVTTTDGEFVKNEEATWENVYADYAIPTSWKEPHPEHEHVLKIDRVIEDTNIYSISNAHVSDVNKITISLSGEHTATDVVLTKTGDHTYQSNTTNVVTLQFNDDNTECYVSVNGESENLTITKFVERYDGDNVEFEIDNTIPQPHPSHDHKIDFKCYNSKETIYTTTNAHLDEVSEVVMTIKANVFSTNSDRLNDITFTKGADGNFHYTDGTHTAVLYVLENNDIKVSLNGNISCDIVSFKETIGGVEYVFTVQQITYSSETMTFGSYVGEEKYTKYNLSSSPMNPISAYGSLTPNKYCSQQGDLVGCEFVQSETIGKYTATKNGHTIELEFADMGFSVTAKVDGQYGYNFTDFTYVGAFGNACSYTVINDSTQPHPEHEHKISYKETTADNKIVYTITNGHIDDVQSLTIKFENASYTSGTLKLSRVDEHTFKYPYNDTKVTFNESKTELYVTVDGEGSGYEIIQFVENFTTEDFNFTIEPKPITCERCLTLNYGSNNGYLSLYYDDATAPSTLPNIEYSTDKVTWTALDTTRINVSGVVYLRGNNPNGINKGHIAYTDVASTEFAGEMVHSCTQEVEYRTIIRVCTDNHVGGISVSGNIMHLLSYESDLTEIPCEGCFLGLFGNTDIVNTPELPATTLTEACYALMFYKCSKLTQVAELNAMNLAKGCYFSMFAECNALVTAPNLPATEMVEACYAGMFMDSTALSNAPTIDAENTAYYSCVSMFKGCTALVNAPTLNATTMSEGCYGSMFKGCTSMTQAPYLKATELVTDCYSGMFMNCTSLVYIKADFLNAPSPNYSKHWVYGITTTDGEFVKNESATWEDVYADYAIPLSWKKDHPEHDHKLTITSAENDAVTYTMTNGHIDDVDSIVVSLSDGSGNTTLTKFDDTTFKGGDVVLSLNDAKTEVSVSVGGVSEGIYITSFIEVINGQNYNFDVDNSPAIGHDHEHKIAYKNLDEEGNHVYTITNSHTSIVDAIDVKYSATTEGGTGFSGYPKLKRGIDGNFHSNDNKFHMVFNEDGTEFYLYYEFSEDTTLRCDVIEYYATIGDTAYEYEISRCEHDHKVDFVRYATDTHNVVYSVLNSHIGEERTEIIMSLVPSYFATYTNTFTDISVSYNNPSTISDGKTITLHFNDAKNLIYADVDGQPYNITAFKIENWFTSVAYEYTVGETPEPVIHPVHEHKMSFVEYVDNETIYAPTNAHLDTIEEVTISIVPNKFNDGGSSYTNIVVEKGADNNFHYVNGSTTIDLVVLENGNVKVAVNGDGKYDIDAMSEVLGVDTFYFDIENEVCARCLTFTSTETSYLNLDALAIPSGETLPNIEYSTDKLNWTSLTASKVSFNGNIYVRGYNPEGINRGTYKWVWADKTYNDLMIGREVYDMKANASKIVRLCVESANETPIAVSGNIMHLINYKRDITEIPNDGCFMSLFYGDNIANAPELPATGLTEMCYSQMFFNCKQLTTAPTLGAENMKYGCYFKMFGGCSSLETAPQLPSNTLATACYYGIFAYCTALVNAPTLNAVKMADRCYSNMFEGCTSLVDAPTLASTSLYDACYFEMFRGCTSLVDAPALPSTNLAKWCYGLMFSHCSSLVNAPELPATYMRYACYENMFEYCTSLVDAPSLTHVTSLWTKCFDSMFECCTNLKNVAPLPNKMDTAAYYYMFYCCHSLETAPELQPQYTWNSNWCYTGMFAECYGLTSAPALNATEMGYCAYMYMFTNSVNIKYVKAMMTNGDGYTGDWMNNVSRYGTFEKNAENTWLDSRRGGDYIPFRWNIINGHKNELVFSEYIGNESIYITENLLFEDTTSIKLSIVPNEFNEGSNFTDIVLTKSGDKFAWTDGTNTAEVTFADDKLKVIANGKSYNITKYAATINGEEVEFSIAHAMDIINFTNLSTEATRKAYMYYAPTMIEEMAKKFSMDITASCGSGYKKYSLVYLSTETIDGVSYFNFKSADVVGEDGISRHMTARFVGNDTAIEGYNFEFEMKEGDTTCSNLAIDKMYVSDKYQMHEEEFDSAIYQQDKVYTPIVND